VVARGDFDRRLRHVRIVGALHADAQFSLADRISAGLIGVLTIPQRRDRLSCLNECHTSLASDAETVGSKTQRVYPIALGQAEFETQVKEGAFSCQETVSLRRCAPKDSKNFPPGQSVGPCGQEVRNFEPTRPVARIGSAGLAFAPSFGHTASIWCVH